MSGARSWSVGHHAVYERPSRLAVERRKRLLLLRLLLGRHATSCRQSSRFEIHRSRCKLRLATIFGEEREQIRRYDGVEAEEPVTPR